MRKFPYGESNFAKVSLENYLYYTLQMPNYVIQGLYYDCFAEILDNKIGNILNKDSLQEAMVALAYQGNAKLFTAEVQQVLKALSNRNAIKFTKKHLKFADQRIAGTQKLEIFDFYNCR
jgi:hypothetical protein